MCVCVWLSRRWDQGGSAWRLQVLAGAESERRERVSICAAGGVRVSAWLSSGEPRAKRVASQLFAIKSSEVFNL